MMEEKMKITHLAPALAIALALSGCSTFKKKQPQAQSTTTTPESTQVQTENKDKEAFEKAASLTAGWPESSNLAAKDMIAKHGSPMEATSDMLIWRNVAPFKRIVVHKTVYSHKFPLLHQNSLEHVVDYRAPQEKIDDVWRYNGSIVLNRTKGEMSSFSDSEEMNILALNLAHDVMKGRYSSESARVMYGKETLNFLNGKNSAYTQALSFGNQVDTADIGESVVNKIRWIGDPTLRSPAQNINTRQAQEEK
jgi:hypothetical protein